jgi:hypothetical protein
MKKTPLLVRLLLLAFLWFGFFAASYLLLDSLGIWVKLPAGLTNGLAVFTGLVLVFALAGHLVAATGRVSVTEDGGRPR